jgi:hypothetical protein
MAWECMVPRLAKAQVVLLVPTGVLAWGANPFGHMGGDANMGKVQEIMKNPKNHGTHVEGARQSKDYGGAAKMHVQSSSLHQIPKGFQGVRLEKVHVTVSQSPVSTTSYWLI